MSNRGTIYLPFEIVEREYWHKAFLCARLLEKGFKVILFPDYYFDLTGYPEKGIYLGKNLFKTMVNIDLKSKNNANRAGVRLFYLDEEAFRSGKSLRDADLNFLKRINIRAFNKNEILLTWTKNQEKIAKMKSPQCKVFHTGSPNFSICNPATRKIIKTLTSPPREPYVLICSSFKGIGVNDSPFGYFKRRCFNNPEFHPREHLEGYENGVHFLRLILSLVKQNKNVKFIFRPHPSEDCQFYQTYFQFVSNLKVTNSGPVENYIVWARCLIHAHCSTGLQGLGFGIPVLSVRLNRTMPYPWKLFDVGMIATSLPELNKKLKQILSRKRKIKHSILCKMHNSVAKITKICLDSSLNNNAEKTPFSVFCFQQKVLKILKYIYTLFKNDTNFNCKLFDSIASIMPKICSVPVFCRKRWNVYWEVASFEQRK